MIEDQNRNPRSKASITLVVIDLVNTVLVHRDRLSRNRVEATLYRNFGYTEPQKSPGTLPSSITDEQILETVTRLRKEWSAMATHRGRWPVVNMHAYEEWLGREHPRYHFARLYGERVHTAIVGDPSLYTVQKGMKDMIRWISAQGVPVVILSNAPCHCVYDLLEAHPTAKELFSAVYCPEELGGLFKPNPDAWRQVLAREMERQQLNAPIFPEHVVHIGNSLNTDTGAAEIGANVLLYNKKENLSFLTDENSPQPERIIIPEQEVHHVRDLIASGLVHPFSNLEYLFSWIKERI